MALEVGAPDTVFLGVAHRRTDQPILIDDDPIDSQERPADQGPFKKIQIDKTIQDRKKPQAIHDLTDDSTQSRWMPPLAAVRPQ